MNDKLNNSVINGLVPSVFYLGQNYPNPFTIKTIIKYCVAYRSRVLLAVYNSKGEEIKKLVNEVQGPGTYEVEFDASASHNFENYTYRLEAGDYRNEKIMQQKQFK